MILAGRRINDSMGAFIAQQTIKQMIHAGHAIAGAVVTVLGLTFKENCPDLRNSRVIDIIRELEEFDVQVQVFDPVASSVEALHEYGVTSLSLNELKPAAAIVVAVAHDAYARWTPSDYLKLMHNAPVVIDVKGVCDGPALERAGARFWRL